MSEIGAPIKIIEITPETIPVPPEDEPVFVPEEWTPEKVEEPV